MEATGHTRYREVYCNLLIKGKRRTFSSLCISISLYHSLSLICFFLSLSFSTHPPIILSSNLFQKNIKKQAGRTPDQNNYYKTCGFLILALCVLCPNPIPVNFVFEFSGFDLNPFSYGMDKLVLIHDYYSKQRLTVISTVKQLIE